MIVCASARSLAHWRARTLIATNLCWKWHIWFFMRSCAFREIEHAICVFIMWFDCDRMHVSIIFGNVNAQQKRAWFAFVLASKPNWHAISSFCSFRGRLAFKWIKRALSKWWFAIQNLICKQKKKWFFSAMKKMSPENKDKSTNQWV